MSCNNNYEYTFEGSSDGKTFTKQLCLKNELTSSSSVDFPYEVIDGVKVYYLDSDVIINNDRYQTTMRYLFDDDDDPITKLTIKKTPNYSTSDYCNYGPVGTESSSVYIKRHYEKDSNGVIKRISDDCIPGTFTSNYLTVTNIGLENDKIFDLEEDGDKKYIMTNEDKSTSQVIVKDKDYYVNTCSYDSLNNQYYNFNGNTKDNLKILTPLDYTLIISSVIFLIILIFQIYLLPIWLIWIFIILGVIAIALVWWLIPKYTCQHITDTIRYKVK